MTKPGVRHDYAASSLSHAETTDRKRMESLQNAWDPFSITHLERVAIEPTWRCADLGAGAGSIACWLADQVPDGEVIATDADTRFLPASMPQLRVLQHDLRHEGFPPASFDLIHIRAVLEYLPERIEILHRAIEWLRPNGRLIVEGADPTLGEYSPYPEIRRATRAMVSLLTEEMNSNMSFVRSVPRLLASAGLTNITANYEVQTVGCGNQSETFFLATLDQLSPMLIQTGRITTTDLTATHDWLRLPGACDAIATLGWVIGQYRS
jgi:2-polyprenyl-3-methyl-5-hydroxy-6-metoxy-1,4-benzoquinol methylase